MLEYKGYIGHVVYDDDAEIFHGDIINMSKDGMTFQGKTVDEIKQAFKDSVDDYLQWAAEEGFTPEKPFSGKFMVRTTPQIHQAAVIAAKTAGLSLNAWIDKAIRNAAEIHRRD